MDELVSLFQSLRDASSAEETNEKIMNLKSSNVCEFLTNCSLLIKEQNIDEYTKTFCVLQICNTFRPLKTEMDIRLNGSPQRILWNSLTNEQKATIKSALLQALISGNDIIRVNAIESICILFCIIRNDDEKFEFFQILLSILEVDQFDAIGKISVFNSMRRIFNRYFYFATVNNPIIFIQKLYPFVEGTFQEGLSDEIRHAALEAFYSCIQFYVQRGLGGHINEIMSDSIMALNNNAFTCNDKNVRGSAYRIFFYTFKEYYNQILTDITLVDSIIRTLPVDLENGNTDLLLTYLIKIAQFERSQKDVEVSQTLTFRLLTEIWTELINILFQLLKVFPIDLNTRLNENPDFTSKLARKLLGIYPYFLGETIVKTTKMFFFQECSSTEFASVISALQALHILYKTNGFDLNSVRGTVDFLMQCSSSGIPVVMELGIINYRTFLQCYNSYLGDELESISRVIFSWVQGDVNQCMFGLYILKPFINMTFSNGNNIYSLLPLELILEIKTLLIQTIFRDDIFDENLLRNYDHAFASLMQFVNDHSYHGYSFSMEFFKEIFQSLLERMNSMKKSPESLEKKSILFSSLCYSLQSTNLALNIYRNYSSTLEELATQIVRLQIEFIQSVQFVNECDVLNSIASFIMIYGDSFGEFSIFLAQAVTKVVESCDPHSIERIAKCIICLLNCTPEPLLQHIASIFSTIVDKVLNINPNLSISFYSAFLDLGKCLFIFSLKNKELYSVDIQTLLTLYTNIISYLHNYDYSHDKQSDIDELFESMLLFSAVHIQMLTSITDSIKIINDTARIVVKKMFDFMVKQDIKNMSIYYSGLKFIIDVSKIRSIQALLHGNSVVQFVEQAENYKKDEQTDTYKSFLKKCKIFTKK